MSSKSQEPVAIVGIGCRFPGGADDPEKLWSLLADGRQAWSDVPEDRFKWKSFYHPNAENAGATNHRGGHFLQQNIRAFDAEFFGIPPGEASAIDPQARIQLETAYEALENAGVSLEDVRGSDTAVYVATFSRDYERMQFKDTDDFDQHTMAGVGEALISNRISYTFDLKGPSVTIETGCSGSLVALHHACQSLRSEECSLALAGGTNLILSPDSLIPMSLARALNADGRSYSFDSRGAGYGRGEGVATVALKRLDDAIRAGDPIRAIIRGTGINQDGRTSGIMLPSQESQQILIQSVLQSASLNPSDIDYVEAHGTGTVAGDSAEIKSIVNTFSHQQRKTPLYIGSVKSNIGHCESTSGLAGLIKAVLAVEKGQIPPTIDLQELKDDLKSMPPKLKIPKTLVEWPTLGNIRRASVNSFGYGGTNAHVVIEQAPSQEVIANDVPCSSNDNKADGAWKLHVQEAQLNGHVSLVDQVAPRLNQGDYYLLTFSAHSSKVLETMVRNLSSWVASKDFNTLLMDISYTLTHRRTAFKWRWSKVVSDLESIAAINDAQIFKAVKVSNSIRLTFVFTGQGAQWFRMGRELIQIYSPFRSSLLKSDKILKSLGADWSLLEELSRDKDASKINESRIAQPATTAVQLALLDLLSNVGIKPEIVIGHSSGEIAAAYAAGCFMRQDALRIAYFRGFVSNMAAELTNTGGAMLAVGSNKEFITPLIQSVSRGKVSIACINSPSSLTISGDSLGIDELKVLLDEQAVFCRKLSVDTAYHSHHMLSISERYKESIVDINYKNPDPEVTFISTVTGLIKQQDFGPAYWVENLVSVVNFYGALETLKKINSEKPSSLNTLVEIGPHSALAGPIRQSFSDDDDKTFSWSYNSILLRDRNAIETVLDSVGLFFTWGYNVDIKSLGFTFNAGERKPNVLCDLPPYPWNYSKEYWHESRISQQYRLREYPSHDLLGSLIGAVNSHEPVWRNLISLSKLPWLRDHIVEDITVLPGSAYITMALEALRQTDITYKSQVANTRFLLKDVKFENVVVIPENNEKIEIQTSLRLVESNSGQDTWYYFRIVSLGEDLSWQTNCHGRVKLDKSVSADTLSSLSEIHSTANGHLQESKMIEIRGPGQTSESDIYSSLRSAGNEYGKNFQTMTSVTMKDSLALTTVVIPDILRSMPAHYMQSSVIHPITLDSFFQTSLPLFHVSVGICPAVPMSIEEMSISSSINDNPSVQFNVSTSIDRLPTKSALATIEATQVIDGQAKESVITIRGLELKGLDGGKHSSAKSEEVIDMIHHPVWGADVDSLTTDGIRVASHQSSGTSDDSHWSERQNMMSMTALRFMKKAVKDLDRSMLSTKHPHYLHLFQWMEKIVPSVMLEETGRDSFNDDEDCAALAELRKAGAQGEMLAALCSNLQAILMGQQEPLSLMLQDDLLARSYAEDQSVLRCVQHLSTYTKSLLFKRSSITVLEIGAGTGGTTLPLLEECDSASSKIKNYDFTDISSGFFEAAKKRLEKWENVLKYKRLDIEKDPIQQEFEAGSYDLIIATDVIHATSPLKDVLSNIRRLLKPSGKFAFIETTKFSPYLNAIFGLLPGWWRGIDEGRIDHPLLTLEQWNDQLKACSFTGTGLSVNDVEGPAQQHTLGISTPYNNRDDAVKKHIEVIKFPHMEMQSYQYTHAGDLNSIGSEKAFDLQVLEKDAILILTDSTSPPILSDTSRETFSHIMSILGGARKVIWISHEDTRTIADSGLINGLVRVARAENSDLKMVILHLQQDLTYESSAVKRAIVKIINQSFGQDSSSVDMEYRIRNDQLEIQRLIPDSKLNILRLDQSKVAPMISQAFSQSANPLKLHVSKLGSLDSMEFVKDELANTSLALDEVEIEPRAFGINFKDVFIALGQLGHHAMLGEYAGIITRLGPQTTSRLHVGDRVIGWAGSPYASRPRISSWNTYNIPETMTFTTAASIPVAFMTAYHSLVNVARLSKSDTILIHAGSGGVGQAAIQIAQDIGAEIYTTVGSEQKRSLLIESYGIPNNRIYSSRSGAFKNAIMADTRGEGVNVVLNSLTRDLLEDSWDCMAMFGTFVEIGKADILSNNRLPLKKFDRNITFSSVDMTLVFKHRPKLTQMLISQLMSLFEKGNLRPVEPIITMPIGEIEAAFRLIQARKHTGKVVLEIDSHSMVGVKHPKVELKLHKDGTYIIAGGSGSLGKLLIKFMAEHGARTIVILTRKTYTTEQRNAAESQIESAGARIHIITCDITNADSVKLAVQEIQKNMPPICGVIQSAMILNDGTLEHMSLEDFQQAVNPKRAGTLNLVEALRTLDYDFFIMLSSIAAIFGTPAQANYAAGCAFQDALAQAPPYDNTHYMSLNLGMIEESDIISKNSETKNYLLRSGCVPITNMNLFNLFEFAMSLQARTFDSRQIVIGFTGESIHQADSFATSKNPMFAHIHPSSTEKGNDTKQKGVADVEASLNAAGSFQDAYSIIFEAIAVKLTALLSVEKSEITLEHPIRDLGLDSLIAIELRNWLVNIIHSKITSAEILDSATVGDLVTLVSKRSAYVSRSEVSDLKMRDEQRLQKIDGEIQKLPPIPLPELSESLNQYVESVASFCTPAQMKSLQDLIADFQATNGFGQELHRRLIDRTHDCTLDDWLYDLYEIDVWTTRRVPLNPWGHFFGVFQTPGVHHSQARQAAIIAQAALRYKERLDAGDIHPDETNGQILDMNLQKWTFNSYLQPGHGRDSIRKIGSANDIIVMSNGHMYNLSIDSNVPSVRLLENAISNIIEQSTTRVTSAATLTADERESWADVRDELMDANPKNRATLDTIEAAAFVICLDQESPETSTERVNQFLLPSPHSRWSDKSLQFVVCRNGCSATVPEHAMLDGDTLNQLVDFVRNSTIEFKEDSHMVNNGTAELGIDELTLVLTPSLQSHINRVKELFHSTVTPVEYTHHIYNGFGSNLCRQNGCAPNATFQLTIQLAARSFFNMQHPCIEAVSTRAFHKGRLDFMPTTIPPVVDFCTAVVTKSKTSAELRVLLIDAIKTLTNVRTNTSRGRGFRNHFLALRRILKDDEEMPEFFKHESFDLIIPGKISTDCAEWGDRISEAGFHRPGDGKVWVHYEMRSDDCYLSIKAPPGQTQEFFEHIQKSADLIKTLL